MGKKIRVEVCPEVVRRLLSEMPHETVAEAVQSYCTLYAAGWFVKLILEETWAFKEDYRKTMRGCEVDLEAMARAEYRMFQRWGEESEKSQEN